MDMNLAVELNRLFSEIYDNVSKIEANALKKHCGGSLSIAEFHMLEAVAKGGADGCTVGEIASQLGVTFPTVTVAANRLAKKGFLLKTRSADDGRVVRITLTREGKRMNSVHRYFHERMIREVCRGTSDGELRSLLETLDRLNGFLVKNLDT